MSEINHSQRAHSRLGASSSKRWMTCTGSVKLIAKLEDEGIIKNEDSPYARLGSAAHELCEHCLIHDKEPSEYIGQSFEAYPDIPVDEEMAEAVKLYVDFVRDNTTPDCDLMIEERFTLHHIDSELYGTGDAAIGQPFGKLMVIDFKYGQGVAVEAKENPQMMYYTAGAAMGGDYLEYEAVIIQPRCSHPEGPIRRWTFDQDRLDRFEKELKDKVIETRSDSAVFIPSEEGCKFCDAKAYCPTIKEKALATAMVVFDDVEDKPILPPIDSIPVAKLGEILEVATLIKGWLKEVEAKVFHQLEHGNKVEGYKLVKGRANRKWKNETAIIEELELLGEEGCFTPPKLLSPAQLEKKVGKEFVATHTEKPSGKLSVVKESDKREAYIPAIEIFKDV